MRSILKLQKDWKFVKSAENAAAAAVASGESITLPHTWNAVDGQDGGNDYHRGTCWYVQKLDISTPAEGERVYLSFDGAAMIATVYLNGTEVGQHKGGYSTFRFDITDSLRAENTLVVAVDNSENREVYPQKADFTFYGGLYRDVSLIRVPQEHFDLDYCGSQGIRVTSTVELQTHRAEVTIGAWVVGDAPEVIFETNGEEKTASVVNGYAEAIFVVENAQLWDGPAHPFLYTAKATLPGKDAVQTRYGIRSYEIDPQKGFILNGRSYPLRGVARHQDRKGRGNALLAEDLIEDMDLIQEIGANTIRLAHYQHSQEFYNLCDERGMVIWAEIPYITMNMPEGRENTLAQMRELVVQNYNHPSIVVWGLSNEITAASPVNETLLENHRALNDLCHELDSTRPTTMANVFMLETDSPILSIPDVNSYNLYFGWYLGDLEQNEEFFDEFHAAYPDMAMGFSEYGADANPQYQSPCPEKGDYTESYQAVYHEHMAEMIEQRPWLWATHVWNMFDFAADGRDEGGKHGENQKGLVTFDRKIKKDAFYLYKAYWNKKQPFVHICGSRYVERDEQETEIKVYSNQPQVELYQDGKLLECQVGRCVFRFRITITGEHEITAKTADLVETIHIRKVAEPNTSYQFRKRSTVTNWFDREEYDAGCFSVKDKVGELKANPAAAEVLEPVLNRKPAAGDVSRVVQGNAALEKMMGRMTLLSMLKQGGTPEEVVRQLNRTLQQIKK